MNKVQITIQALTKRDGPTYTTITNRKWYLVLLGERLGKCNWTKAKLLLDHIV